MTETLQHSPYQRRDPFRTFGKWLTGMNMYVFLSLLFIYHVIVIFQGVDFNDEGFHLAFYQQIFNNPESVQYAFWGWLSGIVGGVFMKVFPFMGAWGIRFMGAIISTATIVIVYNLLKKYVSKGYLMVSLVMLSIFINEDAKNIYYNNLSAFLYFILAYFLFQGLRNRNNRYILVAGLFCGLNIFTRLPNVLGMSMILAIFYYGYLEKSPFKQMIIRSFVFFSGVILSCLLVLALMLILNHFVYFTGSLKMLFSSSNHATQDDGLNGAYGIGRLLKNNLIDYAKSLRFVLITAGFAYFILFIQLHVTKSSRWLQVGFRYFLILLVLTGFVLLCSGWFTSYRLIEFFTGISLLSGLVLFDKQTSNELKLLGFIGGLILLIHPFGSSEGILTVVVYSMWLSFPIAVEYISGLYRKNMLEGVKPSSKIEVLKFVFQSRLFRAIFLILISLITAACIYNVIRYPYLCDRHQRKDMRFSIDNRFMRGIYTSAGRAKALNELLVASSKYIKPNDIVLAYDCMPLYHYMTESRSFVRNPCIWFYTTGLFSEELKYAEQKNRDMPVIVRQLIKTTGEGSAWPEDIPAENYLNFKRTQGKNKILEGFEKRHQYQRVWNNGEFEILVPEKNYNQ
jgi:hypothetical protein